MLLKVFAVYDLKACAYGQPFFSPNSGSAIRAFGDEVSKERSPIMAHPEDYQLFEIGTWDDGPGKISEILPIKYLCCANDFVQKAPSVRVDAAMQPANGVEVSQ